LKAESVPFRLTKFPMSYSTYAPTEETGYGRSSAIFKMKAKDQLVDVIVKSNGADNIVPRIVTFKIFYYQVTAKKKRYIFSEMAYSRFCTTSDSPGVVGTYSRQTPPVYPCSDGDFNYTLDFRYEVCPVSLSVVRVARLRCDGVRVVWLRRSRWDTWTC
jgi:hypothetical protein